jgi:hypothetical protein
MKQLAQPKSLKLAKSTIKNLTVKSGNAPWQVTGTSAFCC